MNDFSKLEGRRSLNSLTCLLSVNVINYVKYLNFNPQVLDVHIESRGPIKISLFILSGLRSFMVIVVLVY